MDEILTAQNLSFSYGGNLAVDSASFKISKGDFVALVGHNGSGKSTLIKLILGILKPDRGEITLFGEKQKKFKSWEKVGYLPQNIGLFNPMFPATVKEVVALGLISKKKFPKTIGSSDYKKVDDALRQMNIVKLKDKLVGELSGGQLQRTLLARAIVNDPELLILDEPVSSVDPETREEFYNYAKKINSENSITIILITHDIGHSVKYTNKLLYLDKKVVFCGDYHDFCVSKDMEKRFDPEILHIICHQH